MMKERNITMLSYSKIFMERSFLFVSVNIIQKYFTSYIFERVESPLQIYHFGGRDFLPVS